MIRILDQYFATSQYIEYKSAYGLLKNYRSPLNNYVFIDDATSPCLIFLHIETVTPDLLPEVYDELLRRYKQNKLNKIVIDTTVEDFVRENFFHITETLEERGVNQDDIFVLTGQNNVPIFYDDFRVKYTVFNVNLFELSFYFFIDKFCNFNEVLRPIVPRKIKYHANSFIKNPRKVRRLLHAYYCLKGYDQYMLNSWHRSDAYKMSDKIDLEELGVIESELDLDKWEEIKRTLEELVTYKDDVEGKGEWIFQPEVIDQCGLVFTNETHHSLDIRSFVKPRNLQEIDVYTRLTDLPIFYRYFLTEKTYKNFAYGMPFVNLGIPGSAEMLGTYGYKSWESLLGITSVANTYLEGFQNAFSAMDKIFNMPLKELEEILNSEYSLNMLKHNRQNFLEQHEFRRLCNILEIIHSNNI